MSDRHPLSETVPVAELSYRWLSHTSSLADRAKLELALSQHQVFKNAPKGDGGRLKEVLNSAFVIALIAGATLIIGNAVGRPETVPNPPVSVVNCAEQQRGALELQKAYPDLDLTYSGPSEEQCHLNVIVDQHVNETAPDRDNP